MVSQNGVTVYGRTSTRKQEERRIIETQLDFIFHDPVVVAKFPLPATVETVKAIIKERDSGRKSPFGDIEGIYLDEGVSGHKKPLGERRQGKRLLADAKAGKLKDTVLIVYRHARLGRKMLDTLQAVADLANNGVTIYDASTHEEIDNSSSKGKLLLGFKRLVAEYERDGVERLAREGKLMPRYPELQIISFEQFARVQNVIETRHKVPNKSAGSLYIYSGLLRCPECGGRTLGRRLRGDKYENGKARRYRCRRHMDYGDIVCTGWQVYEHVVSKAVIPFLVERLEPRLRQYIDAKTIEKKPESSTKTKPRG